MRECGRSMIWDPEREREEEVDASCSKDDALTRFFLYVHIMMHLDRHDMVSETSPRTISFQSGSMSLTLFKNRHLKTSLSAGMELTMTLKYTQLSARDLRERKSGTNWQTIRPEFL